MTFQVPMMGSNRVEIIFCDALAYIDPNVTPATSKTNVISLTNAPERLDRHLFIWLYHNTPATLSLTLNGQPATLIHSVTGGSLWWIDLPAGSSALMVFSGASGFIRHYGFAVYAVYGAASMTPIQIDDASNANPLTASLDIPDGGGFFAGCGRGTNGTPPTLTWAGLVTVPDASLTDTAVISGQPAYMTASCIHGTYDAAVNASISCDLTDVSSASRLMAITFGP